MKVTSNYRTVEPDTEIPGVALRTVISPAEAPRFSMRVFEVAPGSSTPYHNHWWEHEVFILAGRGRVRGPEGERDLSPEDVVYVPGGEDHCFVNAGPGLFRFICVIPHVPEPVAVPADGGAPQCGG